MKNYKYIVCFKSNNKKVKTSQESYDKHSIYRAYFNLEKLFSIPLSEIKIVVV